MQSRTVRRRALRFWHERVRFVALFLASAVVVGAVAVFVVYRRQIVSYLTHWRGGPDTTWVYEAYSESPPVHLAAAGDSGDSGRRLDSTAAAIAAVGSDEPFDALLLLGDLVYPSGDPDRLDATVFQPFSAVIDQGSDLLAILGNHDIKDGRDDEMLSMLGMPGRWWSRTYGSVLVVGLDSTRPDDPGQLAFLEQVLSSSDATWKIVAMHHAPYSAGYQGSNAAVRAAFEPVLVRHGVQLVLSGHDHDYQRSVVIDGVTYVVSGAASGTRRTGSDAFTAVAYSYLHFLDIAVFADRIVVRAVGADGRVADEVTILP